jgi:hypothetical protein
MVDRAVLGSFRTLGGVLGLQLFAFMSNYVFGSLRLPDSYVVYEHSQLASKRPLTY